MSNFGADIDLDFGDRNELLKLIDYTPATMITNRGERVPHNSGIYVTAIPQDTIHNLSAIEYKAAEDMGYLKLDILNNHIYSQVKSPEHLDDILSRPIPWDKLKNAEFTQRLIHLNNYSDMIGKLTEPIDSIEKLAMFLALIRPGKKHLQGLLWSIIEKSIWNRDESDGFAFKKAHAIAYAILITVHMQLLMEEGY